MNPSSINNDYVSESMDRLRFLHPDLRAALELIAENKLTLAQAEEFLIWAHIEHQNGHLIRAAKRAGIGRSTLYRKIQASTSESEADYTDIASQKLDLLPLDAAMAFRTMAEHVVGVPALEYLQIWTYIKNNKGLIQEACESLSMGRSTIYRRMLADDGIGLERLGHGSRPEKRIFKLKSTIPGDELNLTKCYKKIVQPIPAYNGRADVSPHKLIIDFNGQRARSSSILRADPLSFFEFTMSGLVIPTYDQSVEAGGDFNAFLENALSYDDVDMIELIGHSNNSTLVSYLEGSEIDDIQSAWARAVLREAQNMQSLRVQKALTRDFENAMQGNVRQKMIWLAEQAAALFSRGSLYTYPVVREALNADRIVIKTFWLNQNQKTNKLYQYHEEARTWHPCRISPKPTKLARLMSSGRYPVSALEAAAA